MRNKLAEARREKGLTQDTLAKKARVSRPYISDIERGKQVAFSNVVMMRLASALSKKVSDIFFTDDVV